MNQLALFEEPKPRYRLGGGPPSVQDAWERGFSEPVKSELVARLNERVGEWLGWRDYANIRDRHRISCCCGHVLFGLSQEGRILRKEIYFGAERPGDPFKPYLGFKFVYSSVEHGPAPTYPGQVGLRPQDVAEMWAKEIHRIDAKAFLDEAIADAALAAQQAQASTTKTDEHPISSDSARFCAKEGGAVGDGGAA